MYDNYHYPVGADNPSSPWNQSDPKEIDFEVTCSQSLSKTVTVTTDNYVPGASGVDYEINDEGGYDNMPWHDAPDTSGTNWAKEYCGRGHYTPLQLINLFRRMLSDELNNVLNSPSHDITKQKYFEGLIKECSGWCEDEVEFIES